MHIALTGRLSAAFLNEFSPLLRTVRELGHDVTLLVPAPDAARDDAAALQHRLQDMQIPLLTIKTGARAISLWWKLRHPRPDVLLVCGTNSLPSAVWAAWYAGVRDIYALPMQSDALLRANNIRGKIRMWLRRGVTRLALTACRRVFFLTPDERTAFESKKIVPAHTARRLLNGLGVDAEQYPAQPLPDTDAPLFLCVADLTRDTGLEEFAEAARIIRSDYPEVRFRIAGDRPESPQAVSDSDLSLWHTWMEIVPADVSLADELTACTAYVHPGCRDGIPHPALAALATGRPVVTTETSGCREAVLHGTNGYLVPPRNGSALADSLRSLLQDSQLATSMAEASRRYAQERFSAAAACRTLCRDMRLAHTEDGDILPQTVLSTVLKRIFDLVVAVPAFIMLLPVMGVLAYKVRTRIAKDVFFRQTRPGKNGTLFRIFKFKTMSDAKASDGTLLPDAERLSPLGCKLRAASLDELPELWNVITGEMSLVGPRPLLPQYLDRYSPRQARRHEVRPGITGWAQINGRNAASWEDRFEMDVWYVDNHSLMLDLRILFLTVWKVLRKDDISSPGHATCPEFMGTDATCHDPCLDIHAPTGDSEQGKE